MHYRIALADVQEGLRAMTHVAQDVEMDDMVMTRFVAFGDLAIPFCERPGA